MQCKMKLTVYRRVQVDPTSQPTKRGNPQKSTYLNEFVIAKFQSSQNKKIAHEALVKKKSNQR